MLDSKAGADEEVEKSRTQSTSVRRTAAPAAMNDMLTRSAGGQDQAMGVEHEQGAGTGEGRETHFEMYHARSP